MTLLRSALDTDARHVLPAITVPVLVLHRKGDPFTGPEPGRYLAEPRLGDREWRNLLDYVVPDNRWSYRDLGHARAVLGWGPLGRAEDHRPKG